MHRGAGLLLVATSARVGVERFAERKRSFLASGYAGSESLKLDTAFAAGWRLRCGRFVSAPTPPERCLASRQKFSEAGAAATRPQASAATKIWRSRTQAQPSTRGSLVAETGNESSAAPWARRRHARPSFPEGLQRRYGTSTG